MSLAQLARTLAQEVINESSGHNVPAGSESHFKVVVVSEAFAAQKLLQSKIVDDGGAFAV